MKCIGKDDYIHSSHYYMMTDAFITKDVFFGLLLTFLNVKKLMLWLVHNLQPYR